MPDVGGGFCARTAVQSNALNTADSHSLFFIICSFHLGFG